ncbi:MAG: hypothetical protein ABMA13_20135 [Chthoniobacteraceae bacterium]
MAKPAPDRSLSTLGADELIARIEQKLVTFHQARDLALSAGRHTLDRAIDLGELFEEAAQRYPGNYEEWLENHFPTVSKTTAWRWRQLFADRDRLLDGEPDLHRIKDAYVKLGLLPPPAEPDAARDREPGLYSFRLVVSAEKPIDTWSPLDLREFLDHTAKIAELREQAEARLKEIAA